MLEIPVGGVLVSQLGGVSKLKEEGLDLMEIKDQRRRVMKAT